MASATESKNVWMPLFFGPVLAGCGTSSSRSKVIFSGRESFRSRPAFLRPDAAGLGWRGGCGVWGGAWGRAAGRGRGYVAGWACQVGLLV